MNRQFAGFLLAIIVVVAALFVTCEGQITFSRDWKAGKRSMVGVTCDQLEAAVMSTLRRVIKVGESAEECRSKAALFVH